MRYAISPRGETTSPRGDILYACLPGNTIFYKLPDIIRIDTKHHCKFLLNDFLGALEHVFIGNSEFFTAFFDLVPMYMY